RPLIAEARTDDLDYQTFYRQIPKEKFEEARKKTDATRRKKTKAFEFPTLAYPDGSDNPRTYRFDMGPADGPLKKGFTRITKDDGFTWEKGFGWTTSAPVDDYIYEGKASFSEAKNKDYGVLQVMAMRDAFERRNRPLTSGWAHYLKWNLHKDTYSFYDTFLDDMAKDVVSNPDELAFKVSLPNGTYTVSMVIGDVRVPRFGMEVYANGQLVDSNLYTGLVHHRGFSEPASPWAVRVSFPVEVVRNNLRIALRANDNLFKERLEVAVEAPDFAYSQIGSHKAAGTKGKPIPFFGKRIATHGPATQMAIAGITITPHKYVPLELVRQRLFVDRDVTNKDAIKGTESFNQGDLAAAEASFAKIPDSEYMVKACAYLALVGHFDVDMHKQVKLIETTKKVLEKAVAANPDDIIAAEYLQVASYYGEGLHRMIHASERALGQVRTEAAALFKWVSRDMNMYSKALSLIGRSYAQTDPHRWVTSWYLAEEAFIELQELEPRNKVSEYYLRCDPRGWGYTDYTNEIKGAPKWAAQVFEVYNRLLDQIEWWGENRQLPDGRLGGGWGDDVEVGQAWEALMLANPDASPEAMEVVRGIVEGVWWGGEVDRDTGYFDGLADVEHTAEWTGDSQPLMVGLDYGNPMYIERCMQTGKLMRDLWMGVNDRGHRHFKSMALGNKVIGTQYGNVMDAEIDHPLNGRAALAAWWAWWYAPTDDLDEIFRGWARAWLEDSQRAENGKPEWMIPGPIGFHTDVIGGNKAKVWRQGSPKSNCYENPNYTGYILSLFAQMHKLTGDDIWTKPKAAKLNFKTVDTSILLDVPDLDKGFSIDDKYAKLTEEEDLETILQTQRAIWPSMTSEVANTDRIAAPGLKQMLNLFTGGTSWRGMDGVPFTYRKMSRKVALMNLKATPTEAKAIFYSFNDEPEDVDMMLWMLGVGGEFEVKLGVDNNDDDIADRTVKAFTHKHAHRGDPVRFQIPSRQVIVVEVKQTKPGKGMPEKAVDLAMSPADIKYEEGKLSVTVHNIGNKECGPFSVKVWQGKPGKGKLLATFKRDGLEAPHDLAPRVTTETIKWQKPTSATLENPVEITVELDPDDKYYEITERNNVISRSLPFELKPYEVPKIWKSLAKEHGIEYKLAKPFPKDFPKDQIR
ncbi:hypothetical protein ACFL1X_13040, partial [Candidatus Hydrogenedentota bacterium]